MASSQERGWLAAFTKGSKALQKKIMAAHGHKPEFQKFLKDNGLQNTSSVKQVSKSQVDKVKEKARQALAAKAYGATKGTRMGGEDGGGQELRDTTVPLSPEQHSKVKAAERAAKPAKPVKEKKPRAKKAPTEKKPVDRMALLKQIASRKKINIPPVSAKQLRTIAAVGGQEHDHGGWDDLAGTGFEGRGGRSMDEAKDNREYDYEGDMAMSQLKSIVTNAQKLHDMIEPDTNLPEWVQSKITLAEDYVLTAANYMDSEMNEEVEKFKVGDKVKMHTPDDLDWHERKGELISTSDGGHVVKLNDGTKLSAAKHQIKKVDEEVEQIDEVMNNRITKIHVRGQNVIVHRYDTEAKGTYKKVMHTHSPQAAQTWARQLHKARGRGAELVIGEEEKKDNSTMKNENAALSVLGLGKQGTAAEARAKRKAATATENDAPFSGPYKPKSSMTTDKSGAVHTGSSVARDLARRALKKIAQQKEEVEQIAEIEVKSKSVYELNPGMKEKLMANYLKDKNATSTAPVDRMARMKARIAAYNAPVRANEEVEQVAEVNSRDSFIAAQARLTPRAKNVKDALSNTNRAKAATNKYGRVIGKIAGMKPKEVVANLKDMGEEVEQVAESVKVGPKNYDKSTDTVWHGVHHDGQEIGTIGTHSTQHVEKHGKWGFEDSRGYGRRNGQPMLNSKAEALDALVTRHQEYAKKKANEEVEQIDEVGNTPSGLEKLKKVQARAHETMNKWSANPKSGYSSTPPEVRRATKTSVRASNRINKDPTTGKPFAYANLKKEEAEQINEIGDTKKGKEALASYIKKASGQSSGLYGLGIEFGNDERKYAKKALRARTPATKAQANTDRETSGRLAKTFTRKAQNRTTGISRAAVRLAKEEAEQVSEVLKPSMGAGAYISDFVHSKNSRFAGKSKAERTKMALGAYYGAKKSMGEAKLDPVGGEDSDINNDGKHGHSTDKYLMNRRKKISSAIAATKGK